MANVTVTNITKLSSTLASASPGDTVTIAPGVYAEVPIINNVNPKGAVTINGTGVTFKGDFKINNSSNLIFSGLTFDFTGATDPYWPARFTSNTNLTFTGITITGPGSNALNPGGFLFQDTNGITITNSKIGNVPSTAVNIIRSVGVTITGNEFANCGKSGIGVAAVTNLLISDNHFHDFIAPLGTHTDAIQLMTAGTTTQSTNIIITNNTFYRGAGQPFQGIFLQDDLGTIPFSNVIVSNNTLIGTLYDCLWVNGATGNVTLTNNTMVSYPGFDTILTTDITKPVTSPFFANLYTKLVGTFKLTIIGNVSQAYSDTNGKFLDPPPPGNTRVPAIS